MSLLPSSLSFPVVPLAVLSVVYVFMVIEALVAARNERMQRAFGGIEPPGDVYAWMRIAYPGAFLLMGADALWRWWQGSVAATTVAPASVSAGLLVGVAIFTFAKLLKWWAILSLGRFWTFRVIVIPGSARVRSGPYRYLSHPNYVGVIGELVGVALMLAVPVSGLVATLGFGSLILRRLQVERRALATFVRGRV